jgi:hypothetical protein
MYPIIESEKIFRKRNFNGQNALVNFFIKIYKISNKLQLCD